MGNISLEQIDLIMQRANVSYSEAKEALEQCGGDTVEALLLLEKSQKIKTTQCSTANHTHSPSSSTQKFKGFLAKLNATSLILYKGQHTYIDVPLTVAILALIFCCYLSITGLIIAIILGIKIEIKGENKVAEKLNSTIDLMKK